jgi:SHS2 domain-containing protein
MPADRGFEEIPHTADRAMHVWAPDPESLFAEAARGLNALLGSQTAAGPAVSRAVEASGVDRESLLVAFLSELVFAAEQEGLAFNLVRAEIVEKSGTWTLKAEAEGTKILSMDKGVKAVTYHGMRIHKSGRGYEVDIVFDV